MRMRQWICAAFLVATAAIPAWAAEEGGEKRDLFSPYLAEIVTAIVVFLVLLFLLTKLAWKPILNGLRQREDTIKQALDGAAEANAEARRLVTDYEKKLDAAKEEAQAIAEEARKHADETRRRIEEDARSQAEATLARAVKDIDRAKETAFSELLESVTSIAAEAASRIVRKEITPEANAELVDEVVRDFARNREGGGGETS